MRLYYILTLLAAVAILTACTSSKRATQSGGVSSINAEAKMQQTRYGEQLASHFDYDCLSSKVKLSMKGKTLNGKLQMERGKRLCLIVNAPMLGFEIARVEADRDSITMVDKMDKVYTRLSLQELANGHEDEICLEAVECLMLGRIFVPGRGEAKINDFGRLAWTAKEQDLVGTFQGESYTIDYTLGADNHLASTHLAFNKGFAATWNYADYMTVENGKLAGKEAISATRAAETVVEAGMTIGQPTLSKNGWNAFDPGNNYRRVTLSELVEIIKNIAK